MPTIRLYSGARLRNCYYFAVGLQQVSGARVQWTADLEGLPRAEHFRRFLAGEFVGEGPVRRIVIDYGDSGELDDQLLQWCDSYAKVNCTTAQRHRGVLALGPSFGIRPERMLDLRPALGGLGATFRESGLKSLLAERRNFLLRTPRLSLFQPSPAEPGYLFYVASLWEYEGCIDHTNPVRAAWMRAAREDPAITFEGGFLPYPSSPQAPAVGPQVGEFADLLIRRPVPITEWIAKTKRSFAVFNNPAVEDCLGWKLGQYLALGKAIVSTPLSRELPAELVHGQHVHFIAGAAEIPAAISRLRTDTDYRAHLEVGARRYWERNLQPSAMAQAVLDRAAVR